MQAILDGVFGGVGPGQAYGLGLICFIGAVQLKVGKWNFSPARGLAAPFSGDDRGTLSSPKRGREALNEGVIGPLFCPKEAQERHRLTCKHAHTHTGN